MEADATSPAAYAAAPPKKLVRLETKNLVPRFHYYTIQTVRATNWTHVVRCEGWLDRAELAHTHTHTRAMPSAAKKGVQAGKKRRARAPYSLRVTPGLAAEVETLLVGASPRVLAFVRALLVRTLDVVSTDSNDASWETEFPETLDDFLRLPVCEQVERLGEHVEGTWYARNCAPSDAEEDDDASGPDEPAAAGPLAPTETRSEDDDDDDDVPLSRMVSSQRA